MQILASGPKNATAPFMGLFYWDLPMTLASTEPRVQYNGDGATVAFSVTFIFWDAADLRVIHTDASDVETVWTNGSQYTVSGGSGSTGTVTVETSPTDYTPASGEKITIKSNLSYAQTTALPLGGPLPSPAVERSDDKIVRMIQQLNEALGRSLVLPESSATSDLKLPEPTADTVISWNAAGSALENKVINDDAYLTVSAFILTLLDDVDAATARATLGAVSSALTRGYAFAGNSSDVATGVDITTDGNALVGDGTDAVATGIIKQGVHTIFVPAGAMRPTVSNGCAALTDVETTAGRPDMQVLDFDASADEHAQFQVAFPDSWNEGTITYKAFWTTTATDTDGVTWALQGVSVSDGDTIDVAYGTAVTVDDAGQSTAEDLYVTAESGAVTIAGTPAAADMTYFRIFRDVSDANDTAAEDARLIGVQLFYTVNASDDS